MQIGTILKWKFGREKIFGYTLCDCGDGVFFEKWDEEIMKRKQPTDDELKKWDIQMQKENKA